MIRRTLPALAAALVSLMLVLGPKRQEPPHVCADGRPLSRNPSCPSPDPSLLWCSITRLAGGVPALHRRWTWRQRLATKNITVILATLASLCIAILPTLAQTAGFVESFDGAPPQPADYTNPHLWDFMVFGVNGRQPNVAQHGPNCEAPGFPYTSANSHPFTTSSQAVFVCNNHVMTSLGITGYGAVYMTPPAVADFSGGSARIAFDMSTLRTSSRDWVYVTLTPFGEHHEMPYLNTDQHIPPHNILIRLGGANTFEVFQGGSFQQHKLSGQDSGPTWNDVFHAQTPPTEESPVRRDTFEITLTRSTVSLCMPNYTYRGQQPFCWARNAPLHEPLDPAVWGDQASVQITHVTYNAEKACEDEALSNGFDANTVLDQFSIVHNAYGDAHCPPNTWHWDNVSISPAVPYAVVPSVPADFTANSGRVFAVAFPSPAPASSYLSFVSFGDTPQLRVSFDNGRTWLPPHFQEATALAHPEVGEHVFMPIPEGQQSVMVRGANGYWGGFEAQAFKIVSPPSGTLPPATPTPTASPTPAVPPTSTPTAVPRPTFAVPTDTPVPTVAPTPIATPSVCSVTVTVQNGALDVTEQPCPTQGGT